MNEKKYLIELGKKSGSRLNAIIAAVQAKTPKDKAGLKDDVERMFYDRLVKEAADHKKKYGVEPVFQPVEIESDDPALDIYK